MPEGPTSLTKCSQLTRVDGLLIWGSPRAQCSNKPSSLTHDARNYKGGWAADFGQPVRNARMTFVADQMLPTLKGLMCCNKGSPVLNARRPHVAERTATSTV